MIVLKHLKPGNVPPPQRAGPLAPPRRQQPRVLLLHTPHQVRHGVLAPAAPDPWRRCCHRAPKPKPKPKPKRQRKPNPEPKPKPKRVPRGDECALAAPAVALRVVLACVPQPLKRRGVRPPMSPRGLVLLRVYVPVPVPVLVLVLVLVQIGRAHV